MTDFKIGDIVRLKNNFVKDYCPDKPDYFMFLILDVNSDKTYNVVHLWSLKAYISVDMEMYRLA